MIKHRIYIYRPNIFTDSLKVTEQLGINSVNTVQPVRVNTESPDVLTPTEYSDWHFIHS